MLAAPTFGISPSEKQTLDLVTDHPMIPRKHLARWLGVSEGRVSQMMHNLVDALGLASRTTWRHALHPVGRGHPLRHPPGPRPVAHDPGHLERRAHADREGRRRHVGHRIDTWARQTKHADGVTWFLSELEAEARTDPSTQLLWSIPTAKSDRAFNWGIRPSPPMP